MTEIVEILKNGQDLSFEQSKTLFSDLMEGKHSDDSIIEILESLIRKCETKDEIAGGIYVLRNKAKKVIGLTNVLISGGLNTENIESLLKNFSPYGIDTSSGVETNGIKDLKKIKRFIELAKN